MENWGPRTCLEASVCHLVKLQVSLVKGRAWSRVPFADSSLQTIPCSSVAAKGCLKGTAKWNTLLYLDASQSVVSLLEGVMEKAENIPWQAIRFQVQIKFVFSHIMLFFCHFQDVTQEFASLLCQKKISSFVFL